MRRSKKRNTSGEGRERLILIGIASSIILLDIITKLWIKGKDIRIAEYLSLSYTTNTGAGFSMLQGYNGLLIFSTILILGVLLYNYASFRNDISRTGAALVIGGGMGNLIDRIAYGHVIDFIDFKVFPVFNIADSAVTVGVIILIFSLWRNKE